MVTLADTECILCVATFSCTLPSDSSTKLVRGAPAWGMKQAPEAREAAQIVRLAHKHTGQAWTSPPQGASLHTSCTGSPLYSVSSAQSQGSWNNAAKQTWVRILTLQDLVPPLYLGDKNTMQKGLFGR